MLVSRAAFVACFMYFSDLRMPVQNVSYPSVSPCLCVHSSRNLLRNAPKPDRIAFQKQMNRALHIFRLPLLALLAMSFLAQSSFGRTTIDCVPRAPCAVHVDEHASSRSCCHPSTPAAVVRSACCISSTTTPTDLACEENDHSASGDGRHLGSRRSGILG